MKLTQQINEIPYNYLAIGILVGFLAPYAWEIWNSQPETKAKTPVAE